MNDIPIRGNFTNYGKTIEKVVHNDSDDESLEIYFIDGTGHRIADEGRSCCENRYMVVDDDLAEFTGAAFYGAAVKTFETTEESPYGDEHEVMFLEVTTSKGPINISTHNEHNGYYGGFDMNVTEI